jgi:acyl dehydratase
MSRLIENRTFDELKIGGSARLSRTLTRKDIELFAILSGDVNPAHVDDEFARSDMFHHIIAHGMWGAALISTVLGTELPGPGTIYLDQTLHFRAPTAPGDTVDVTVTVCPLASLSCRIPHSASSSRRHLVKEHASLRQKLSAAPVVVNSGPAVVVIPAPSVSEAPVHGWQGLGRGNRGAYTQRVHQQNGVQKAGGSAVDPRQPTSTGRWARDDKLLEWL